MRERLTEVDALFAGDDGRQIILGLTARPQWRDAVEAGMIAPDAAAAEVAPLPLVTDRYMDAPDGDGWGVCLGRISRPALEPHSPI
ncbi:hypothetical protein ACIP46_27235 [Streptomyces lavendulae]|uniref:hypothetical protein n=1 Tax=Streptomyces lavendulae TaxID=1914 RepID=UPI003808430B